MTSHPNLDQLNPEELRALAAQLIQRVETMDKQITHHKSVNEKLAHEIALLKRFKFAKRSEQLSPDQASLLDDLIDTDIAAIEAELEALQANSRWWTSKPQAPGAARGSLSVAPRASSPLRSLKKRYVVVIFLHFKPLNSCSRRRCPLYRLVF
jgi:hypothetical protein